MRLPRLRRLALLFAVVPLGAFTCFGEEPAGEPPSDPVAVAAEAAAPDKLLLLEVVGRDAADLVERIRQEGFFRWVLPELEGWRVEVASAALDDARPDVRIVVGLLPLPREARDLFAELPVELNGTSVVFAGTAYAEDELQSLTLRRPRAAREAGDRGAGGAPDLRDEAWLVTGRDPEGVAEAASYAMVRAIGGRVWGQQAVEEPDYVVRVTDWLQRTGRWRRTGDAWEVDPAAEDDPIVGRDHWFAALVEVAPAGTAAAGEGAGEPRAVRLLAPKAEGARPEMAALAGDLERTTWAMARRVGGGRAELLLATPITIAVERDFVAQAQHTGEIGPAVAGGPADLHIVVHPDDRWAYEHALALELLRRAAPREGLSRWAREGAALWLSGGWYGRPFEEWIPSIAAAGALPSASELVAVAVAGASDRGGEAVSTPLWTPAAAAVVAALPGRTAVERLERFQPRAAAAALAALARRAGEAPAPPAHRPLPPGFRRGVSFAMLNTLDGGYQAPGVGDSLRALRRVGADSVSLMPFAYQADPRRPGLRFLNGSPTSETDVGLVHAARAARREGLTVLWKPHIWVSRQSWPGEIEMETEEDWAAWWRGYRLYVLHHAFLARWAGAELFAIGVELEKTVERPEWRDLIADVRVLYPGAVTYAANWGSGAERATFWDLLDAVGVDAYYPLVEAGAAPAQPPTDRELAAGARRVTARLAALARRTGKPLLLTEVGFAAKENAWQEAHQEGGTVSEEDQLRAYRALLGALRGEEGWLRGIYVWKAFSGELPLRREGRADFRFLDRPAAREIAAYFRTVEQDQEHPAR